jgi:hypothetical protein
VKEQWAGVSIFSTLQGLFKVYQVTKPGQVLRVPAVVRPALNIGI